MFHSFHEMKECHNEEMDHIEKLREECVRQKISTDEQTVSLRVYSFVVNISLSSNLISKIFSSFSVHEKVDKTQEPQTEEDEDNAKREQLKVLRNEIKILSDLVGTKEKTSPQKLLADLRAQKLVLEIQKERRHKKSLLSKDENSGIQISIRSGDDEHLSTHPL